MANPQKQILSANALRCIVALMGLGCSTYLLSKGLDGVAGAGFGMVLAWYFSKS